MQIQSANYKQLYALNIRCARDKIMQSCERISCNDPLFSFSQQKSIQYCGAPEESAATVSASAIFLRIILNILFRAAH